MPHGGTVDQTHLSLERGATYLDGDENCRTLSHPATSVLDSAVANKGCLPPLALGLQLESDRISRFRLDELDSLVYRPSLEGGSKRSEIQLGSISQTDEWTGQHTSGNKNTEHLILVAKEGFNSQ